MNLRELDALLANLDLVRKDVPVLIDNPVLDPQQRASIEVTTEAAPDTIRRWVRLAGGTVTKMYRPMGQGAWVVELDWR